MIQVWQRKGGGGGYMKKNSLYSLTRVTRQRQFDRVRQCEYKAKASRQKRARGRQDWGGLHN